MAARTQQHKLELHIKAMLDILGHADLDAEPEFADTPRRVAQYLQEFHQKFFVKNILPNCFDVDTQSPGLVAQIDIPFRGMCAHHLLPFKGKAAIGYVPYKKIIGLSKLARITKVVGLENPGIQETMTNRIANALMEVLDPKGVIVVIEAEHTCMTCRGVATPNVSTITSSVRGIFRDVPAARQEFFSLLDRSR